MAIRYPKNLKTEGRKFWRSIHSNFEIDDPHHLQILGQASRCLDEIQEKEEIVNAEGSYFTDRWGQPKEHPALKTIRDNKILFARLMRELNLDIEAPKESRPPSLY